MNGNVWINPGNETRIGFTIDHCMNTTANGNWCKTKSEINDWLNNNIHYFLLQKTRVNAEIWADDPTKINEDEYFPTVTTSDFTFYKSI